MSKNSYSDQGTLGAEMPTISHVNLREKEMIDKRKDVDAALAELRLSIERLTNGLRQSIETQATQTVMLQAILDAATAPLKSEQDLTNACAQILATLKDQTNLFSEIHRALTEPATAAK